MGPVNAINKDELFSHVREFLKTRGIELQEGSYSRTIEKGCQVLADTINLSQQAVDRARSEVEKTLEKVRHSIHQKTAPRKPPRTGEARTAPADTPPKEPASEAPREDPPKTKRQPGTRKPAGKRPTPKRTRRAS
jgi:hypothetical protein